MDGETPKQAKFIKSKTEVSEGRTGKNKPEYGAVQRPIHDELGLEFTKQNWPRETCLNITEVKEKLLNEKTEQAESW